MKTAFVAWPSRADTERQYNPLVFIYLLLIRIYTATTITCLILSRNYSRLDCVHQRNTEVILL